jgi:hypothetical protein
MDHLSAMLNGNLDDLVASEISTNRGVLPALANDVGLVGLCGPSSADALIVRLREGKWRILCLCIERRSS